MTRTPTAARALRCTIAGIVIVLSACDAFNDSPRAAWERAMTAYAGLDYGALWDTMSQGSKDDTTRVFEHVKSNGRYHATMREKFGLELPTLEKMTPREFFVALMSSVDAQTPQLRRLRVESAKQAIFSHQEIRDDRALVHWHSKVGGAEKMLFVNEGGRWKPVIKR